jgi:hypothetical protein
VDARGRVHTLMDTGSELAFLAADGTARVRWSLRTPGHPDLSVVELLAALSLGARRRGERLVLAGPTPELLG